MSIQSTEEGAGKSGHKGHRTVGAHTPRSRGVDGYLWNDIAGEGGRTLWLFELTPHRLTMPAALISTPTSAVMSKNRGIRSAVRSTLIMPPRNRSRRGEGDPDVNSHRRALSG